MKKLVRKISLALAVAMVLGLFHGEEVFAKSKYDEISMFFGGIAETKIREVTETRIEEKSGLINDEGKVIAEPIYDEVWLFREGLARVKITKDQVEKYGLIDKSGKEIVEPIYNSIGDFYDGLAVLKKGDGYNSEVIDKTGKIVVPAIYSYISDFENGLAVMREDHKKGKYGVIDKKGEVIVKPVYDNLFFVGENMFYAVLKNKGYFLNEKGKKVAKLKRYANVERFSEGLLAVQNKKMKWGLVNKKGKEIVKPKYEYVGKVVEGLLAVRDKDGKWGFINKKGKEVVKPKYAWVWDFHEGLARVDAGGRDQEEKGEYSIYTDYLLGKFGFIDKNGREVVKPQYAYAEDFQEGLAPVVKGSKPGDTRGPIGFIDKTGKMVIKPSKDNRILIVGDGERQIGAFNNGKAMISKCGGEGCYLFLYGFMDKKGKKVVEPKYSWISDFKDGFAVVSIEKEGKDGKIVRSYGYMDMELKEVGKIKYAQSWPFYDGYGMVTVDEGNGSEYNHMIGYKFGYVDKTGKEVIKPKYDSAAVFNEGIAPVLKGNQWFIIDKNEKILHEIE